MTGNLILNADPTVPLGAATKQYVDAVAQGLNVKGSVLVATTTNIVLSGPQTIDGVAVVAGNRVLVKNQTLGQNNGIYVVAAGAWTRSTDMDTGPEADGAFVFVEEGTTQSDTGWVQTTNPPITIGTTPLVFAQFSGAGSYTADGNGLKLVGTQFFIQIDGTTLSQSVLGIKVATGGITNNEINASASIAYSKLNLVGSIVNADINATAGIVYSKLSLTNSILNADINAAAAIAYSKLNLSNSIVNADINAAAAIAYSKLNLSASIVNADINAAAAIARSKIAAGAPNQVVINDGAGLLSSEAVLSPSRGGTGISVSGTANQFLRVNNAGTANIYVDLLGTTNQITTTNNAGNTTLSLPQDIALASTPTFSKLTLSSTTNQLVLGTTNTTTINSTAPSSSRIYTIADMGINASFVMTDGTQSIAGSKTFTTPVVINPSSLVALTVGTNTLIVDTVNGAVGINTAPATTAVLDLVNNSGSTKTIQVTGYGSNVGFRGREAGGTLASPTATASGTTLTFFSGRGYGATGFAAASTGVVNIVAAETFTDSTMATYVGFNTTNTGSITSTERMRVSPAGNLLIGTTTDNATDKLQVNGSVTVAKAFKITQVTLTDAANIATDTSLSNNFIVTLAGNRNLSAPTNPTNAQKVVWIFKQDATGGRTLTFDAIFNFGAFPTLLLSSGANKEDYMGAIYDSGSSKWNVVAYSVAY